MVFTLYKAQWPLKVEVYIKMHFIQIGGEIMVNPRHEYVKIIVVRETFSLEFSCTEQCFME